MKLERPRFTYHRWLPTALFSVLAGAFCAYVWSEHQIDQASEQRWQSLRLTDELRQLTDERTRLARTYVVTRDTRYKLAYQAVLEIADGTRTRPADYQNGYWDTTLVSTPATAASPAQSLLTLMQQAGFTQSELAKSSLLPGSSDLSKAIESKALQLLESSPGQDSQARAPAVARRYLPRQQGGAKTVGA